MYINGGQVATGSQYRAAAGRVKEPAATPTPSILLARKEIWVDVDDDDDRRRRATEKEKTTKKISTRR